MVVYNTQSAANDLAVESGDMYSGRGKSKGPSTLPYGPLTVLKLMMRRLPLVGLAVIYPLLCCAFNILQEVGFFLFFFLFFFFLFA